MQGLSFELISPAGHTNRWHCLGNRIAYDRARQLAFITLQSFRDQTPGLKPDQTKDYSVPMDVMSQTGTNNGLTVGDALSLFILNKLRETHFPQAMVVNDE